MSGDPIGQPATTTESLSSWAAPYVTDMLGKGQALSNMPFTAYSGPLTAGQSPLQTQAFQGLSALSIPTAQQMTYNPMSFTGSSFAQPMAQQPMAQQPMAQATDLGGQFGELERQYEQALTDKFGAYRGENQFTQLPMFSGNLGPDDRPIGETRPVTQADIERFRATSQSGGLGRVSMPAGYAAPTPTYYPAAGETAAQQPMQQSPIEQYMTPYLQGALDPQYAAAQRQADIAAQNLQSQYGKAGAYGGSRQGIAEAELQRGLLDRMSGITGKGYQDAFTAAQNQFNTEQNRQMQAAQQAQQFGLQALGAQGVGGAAQRGIESEGVAADYAQFREERDYPQQQTLYQQQLLQGLPIGQKDTSYVEPSSASGAFGILGTLAEIYKKFTE